MKFKWIVATYIVIECLIGLLLTKAFAEDNVARSYHRAEQSLEEIRSRKQTQAHTQKDLQRFLDDASAAFGTFDIREMTEEESHEILGAYEDAFKIYEDIRGADRLSIWVQQLRDYKQRAYLLNKELNERQLQQKAQKNRIVKAAVDLSGQPKSHQTASEAEALYDEYQMNRKFDAQQMASLQDEFNTVQGEIGRLAEKIRTTYNQDPDKLVPKITEKTTDDANFPQTPFEAVMNQNLEALKDRELSMKFQQLVRPKINPVLSIHQDTFDMFKQYSAK